MSSTKFKIGDKIEMQHLHSASGGALSEKNYYSQLLDFDDIDTAKISMPFFEGRVIPLEVGDKYKLCFYTSAGLYQCDAVVEKRYLIKNIHVVEVRFLNDLKKFQRRKFFRLEGMIDIKYRLLTNEEIKIRDILKNKKYNNELEKKALEKQLEEIDCIWNDATAIDISAGGIKFTGPKEVEPGSVLEVVLPIENANAPNIKFLFNTIFCMKTDNTGKVYQIRGEFSEITDKQQDIIVKYVFEEQRKRMKKD